MVTTDREGKKISGKWSIGEKINLQDVSQNLKKPN